MNEPRYQVFVSSTYTDLKEEREIVMQILMKNDYIPAGMEFFSAIDEKQFEHIKRTIDNSDYYLLIIAGRYGSLTEDGISYTEKEFDYAIEKGKKVICLIHKNINDISLNKSEKDPEIREKLSAFSKKVQTNRLVDFWGKPDDLKAITISGLIKTAKHYPAIGYVRADSVTESNKVLKLKNRIKELEEQLKSISNNKNYNIKQIIDIADKSKESFVNKDMSGKVSFNYSSNNGSYFIGKDNYLFETKWSKASNKCIHAYSYGDTINKIGYKRGIKSFTNDLNEFDFTSRCQTVYVGDIVAWINNNNKLLITKILSIKDNSRSDDRDELSFEYTIYI